MASVAGRKKSIVASAVQIDSPVANNTLLNKAAASSLYQQCSALRARLLRIRGFSSYFSLPNANHARQSTDPVSHLWDLFSFGIPLCYIFDCLDGFPKINNSTFNPDEYDANPDKPKKRAIALFAMQTKKVLHAIPGCEEFTVTDLWDRNSTDGLVKVINTVTAIVDHLPPHAFEPPSPTASSHPPNDSFDRSASESPIPPANAQETARNNIIRELVETERKYVQDLEIMQKYSNALSQGNIIDQDTIHLLFPNLNKLLNFQRKFLIRFESTAELPWQSQQWGQLFLESEDEFVVYEPYCANYTSASELMLEHEQKLNASAFFPRELPAFLIKPIQRVCKYPLLLDSLIKACNNSNYQHFDELKRGSEAAKRITDKINEAQRRAENEATVKSLQSRIDDWKGHHLENFGELLLDDIFIVTKSEVDREYHVFLFEKIILCCKEALPQPQNGKKMGKSNSILKKQPAPPPLALPGGVGQPVRKNTPLLLKGRIFLGNVTQAIPGPIPKSSPNNPIPTYYPLAVWWKGDDDLEYFTLRCRQQEQVRLWETAINRLIKESAARRASERSALSRIAAASSAYAPTHTRGVSKASQSSSQSHHSYSPYGTSHSMYSSTSMTSATSSRGPRTPYGSDEFIPNTNSVAYGSGNGPSGYHNGFEFDQDSDDYDEHQPSSSYGDTSGRGTPIASGSINGTGYRRNNAMSMPPERDALPAYERPRAHTEGMNGAVMQQWRDNLPPVPTPPDMPLHPNTRGYNPRLNAGMNTQSFLSDSSYTSVSSAGTAPAGYPSGPRSRPQLRSQFSSNKLRGVYDNTDSPTQRNSKASTQPALVNVDGHPVNALGQPINAHGQPITSRSRSVSQPAAYVPRSTPTHAPPPPLPTAIHQWPRDRAQPTPVSRKRGSGSSESSSSDYSPNSSSPQTPFGSSESSIGGVSLHQSRSQYFDGAHVHAHAYARSHIVHHANGSGQSMVDLPVKVKVHFHEDIFVIQVDRATEYGDLVEKVGRKIRLCGPRRDDGPLRVKYKDEDGDMVSLGSTEDVQMAFEAYRPGAPVTLFVT
ncbi:Rho guanine nucleotide exchange factor scd1 [Termitomyces sp. T112]|nr:Rho guanine nucleotide exchange factor scd1 [Termitomyces sp. T112]